MLPFPCTDRLKRQRARRRATAAALHALRHDREYLLGLLPPHATAIILSKLDPVSLGSFRQASRQAYLLVSCSIKRMVMGLPDLIKYSLVPLEAVYPNLEVGGVMAPLQVKRNIRLIVLIKYVIAGPASTFAKFSPLSNR